MVSRTPERGAAIFIVVMVIALLTAVGLFAARAASLTETAAGFDRQSLQALALAEYAGRAATMQLGAAPSGYLKFIQDQTEPEKKDKCEVNQRITNPSLLGPGITRPPCYNIYFHEILNAVSNGPLGVTNLLVPQSLTDPGSLGPVLPPSTGSTGSPNSIVDGVFKVELTDGYQESTTPPGMESGGKYRPYRVTLTAFSQIRSLAVLPTGGTETVWCGPNLTSTSANIQAVRAYVAVMSE
jgi:hypothetical protein